MLGIEDELENLSAVIFASERWADQYSKTPEVHAKLIKNQARYERKLRKYFKELSAKAFNLVNWGAYHVAINAYNVDVIVNDAPLEDAANTFINVSLENIAVATALGAQSGQDLYAINLGITSADSVIQDIALNHVAELVGKLVGKDDKIIDNPNPALSIIETTRQDIRSSIQTSIALGEDVSSATDRLSSIIDNPARAELIARTETVNSFGDGLLEFGNQSGAVGKEWQDNGAVDVCADNTDAGPIDISDQFPSGDDSPAAHPNCRCSMRLIYQNEVDNNPDLFGSDDSGDNNSE